MEIRFRVDPNGSPVDHDYLVDRVAVEWAYDADEYTLLNDAVEKDVRKMRAIFVVEGVFESTNGSTKTKGDLLLDLLRGADTIRFFPDKANAAVWADVIPDVSRADRLLATRFGMIQRGTELRLKEATWHDPSDAILDQFAQLTPLT